MADTYRETRTVRNRDDDDATVRPTSLAARIISIIGGLIMALLGVRFLFMLLGANAGNAIADFVYTTSRPFVAPFFGLFNYDPQFGQARFEIETLIAILFYGVITWLIIRLVTIGDRRPEV
jgi:hypothetical protein